MSAFADRAMTSAMVAGISPPTKNPVIVATAPNASTTTAFVERTGSGSSGCRSSGVSVTVVTPQAHHTITVGHHRNGDHTAKQRRRPPTGSAAISFDQLPSSLVPRYEVRGQGVNC